MSPVRGMDPNYTHFLLAPNCTHFSNSFFSKTIQSSSAWSSLPMCVVLIPSMKENSTPQVKWFSETNGEKLQAMSFIHSFNQSIDQSSKNMRVHIVWAHPSYGYKSARDEKTETTLRQKPMEEFFPSPSRHEKTAPCLYILKLPAMVLKKLLGCRNHILNATSEKPNPFIKHWNVEWSLKFKFFSEIISRFINPIKSRKMSAVKLSGRNLDFCLDYPVF